MVSMNGVNGNSAYVKENESKNTVDSLNKKMESINKSIPDSTSTVEEKEKAIKAKEEIIRLKQQMKTQSGVDVSGIDKEIRILRGEIDAIRSEILNTGSVFNSKRQPDTSGVSVWNNK